MSAASDEDRELRAWRAAYREIQRPGSEGCPADDELAGLATGEAAGEIGFAKPLGDYSEAEALQVIDAIVTCWTDAMVAHHEVSKYPPVRGMPPTPDPLANPFADLEDDLPWEEPKGKKP